MADKSDRISQLKIDRSAPPPAKGRQPIWLIAIVAIAVIVVAGWFLFGSSGGSIIVETDVARRPPSAAAASSVLDASGYVVARRQTTVSSKVTGKVLEIFIEEGMRVDLVQSSARRFRLRLGKR